MILIKKIVLLFFTLVILSCSKENSDNSLTTDPIIGIWVDSSTGGNSRGTIVIEPNGIALSAIEGDTCWMTSWRTSIENPDFTQASRYYEFTYSCGYNGEKEYVEGNNEVIFSDNFNTMTFGDFIGKRHVGSVIYESQGPTD